MPESIIKPIFKTDLSLFTRIMPSFVIGERVICLNGIEHINYDWPEDDESVGAENGASPPMLTITYQSGNTVFLDQDEERELEAQIRAGIQKSEELQKQQMNLAMENAQLKQEITRLMANQMQGKLINPGFGKRH